MRLVLLKNFFAIFLVGSAWAQSGKLVVTNATGVTLKEEPVILPRASVSQFVDIPDSKSKILILRQNGKDIPSQLDDLDGDGNWDELAFQINLERNSKEEIKLKWVEKSEAPSFPRRVHCYLGVAENQDGKFESRNMEICPENRIPGEQPPRYHMEGPVWENEKVGFRYFLDQRNSIDVFGKNLPRLLLDSVGFSNTRFNLMQSWGMRIWNAEGSLGFGGIALMDKGLPQPIRKTDPVMFTKLADGPCRAMFDLTFENWRVNGQTYQLRQRISIWAGKYAYQNEILLSGFTGIKSLAVGLGGPEISETATYKTLTNNYQCTFIHGKQSLNKDFLGAGLLFSGRTYDGIGETERLPFIPHSLDTLSHTHFAQLKIKSGQPLSVTLFCGWEKSEAKFSSARYFLDYIQEDADSREVVLKFSDR